MRAFHRGKYIMPEGMAYVTLQFSDSLIASFSVFADSSSFIYYLNVTILKTVTLMEY